MNPLINSVEQKIRLKNEFSLGIPVLIKKNNENFIVSPIETLKEEYLKKFFKYSKKPPTLVITKKRAQTLNVMVYDKKIARIKLPKNFNIDWLKKTADPTFDLSSPLKGPYNSIRGGSTEVAEFSIEVCKAAMLLPSIIICKISKKNRSAYNKQGLLKFNISKIKKKFEKKEIIKISDAILPLKDVGQVRLHVFKFVKENNEHYAIEIGSPSRNDEIVVRIHSSCFTGDVLNSLKCDCGQQLKGSLDYIKKVKKGIIIYLNQEGRGIGLGNKMRAYTLQNQGFDTVEANYRLGFEDDERDLQIGSKIIKFLGFKEIKIITNNPKKINSLKKAGLKVSDYIKLETIPTKENEDYLKTKAKKSGHFL